MTPNQIAARKLGAEASAACLGAQEERDAGFGERAYAFICQYIGDNGPISGELVTNAAKQAGLRPKDDRCFGALYAKAIRRGAIRVVGTTTRIKGHGSGGARIYVAGEAA